MCYSFPVRRYFPCFFEKKFPIAAPTAFIVRLLRMGWFFAVNGESGGGRSGAFVSDMTPASEFRRSQKPWIFQNLKKKIFLFNHNHH